MIRRSHLAPLYPGAGPINAASPATSVVRWTLKAERGSKRRHQTMAANWSAPDMTDPTADTVLDQRAGNTQSP